MYSVIQGVFVKRRAKVGIHFHITRRLARVLSFFRCSERGLSVYANARFETNNITIQLKYTYIVNITRKM